MSCREPGYSDLLQHEHDLGSLMSHFSGINLYPKTLLPLPSTGNAAKGMQDYKRSGNVRVPPDTWNKF